MAETENDMILFRCLDCDSELYLAHVPAYACPYCGDGNLAVVFSWHESTIQDEAERGTLLLEKLLSDKADGR